jgi:AmmeMemoRadiSam system protein A
MFPLTSEEKAFLLYWARQSIRFSVAKQKAAPPTEIPPRLVEEAGVFVSLYRGEELRGCVGYVERRKALYRATMEVASAAALEDPRFPPIRLTEVSLLEIEISVLSPCQPIAVPQIQVGVHGLVVTQGKARGLLLPQVATEHQWSPERFLEEACRKAGLSPEAWKSGARIEAFTAEVFGES